MNSTESTGKRQISIGVSNYWLVEALIGGPSQRQAENFTRHQIARGRARTLLIVI